MSTSRHGSKYHYYKGPYKHGTCRYCGKKVKPPRRTFCSDKCVDELMIRRNPGWAASAVAKRDKGVCGRCGLDTRKLRKAMDEVMRIFRKKKLSPCRLEFTVDGKRVDTWKVLWEAHHKKAVVEGGGECGLDGYETMCVWCHRAETAVLAERRAMERQAEKPKEAEQMKLVEAGGAEAR